MDGRKKEGGRKGGRKGGRVSCLDIVGICLSGSSGGREGGREGACQHWQSKQEEGYASRSREEPWE